MAIESTSFHALNADKGLTRSQKGIYVAANWANNLFPHSMVAPDLLIRDFLSNNVDEYWPRLYETSSPNRKLSNLFWMELPWEEIREELKNIHILDCGCGSGNYSWRLSQWSGNRIAGYTGIDSRYNDNWESLRRKDKNFEFFCCDIINLPDFLNENTNFIISQSSIEHFEKDIRYFKQIRDFIKKHKKNVIQVHLFPSSVCLKLYRLHGIRQYTPRTVSLITNLFKEFSYSVLFNLGGEMCNRLHYDFITKPLFIDRKEDLRYSHTKQYDKALGGCIKEDMKNPGGRPAYYALVIHSNWKNKLFDA